MLSAISFNLEQSKILSSGNGLSHACACLVCRANNQQTKAETNSSNPLAWHKQETFSNFCYRQTSIHNIQFVEVCPWKLRTLSYALSKEM